MARETVSLQKGKLIAKEKVILEAIRLITNEISLDVADLPPPLRERVRELLLMTASPRYLEVDLERWESITPEARKKRIEIQYYKRLETLKLFDFIGKNGDSKNGNSPLPNFSKVYESFSEAELQMACHYSKPTLLLIPECSFASKVKIIDAHKIFEDQIDTYLDLKDLNIENTSDQIIGWRAVIGEGAANPGLLRGDDLNRTIADRISIRKASRKNGERGFDLHSYAMLTMESIMEGTPPIDQKFWTILEDEFLQSNSCFVRAGFYKDLDEPCQFEFSEVSAYEVNDIARFRPCVGGNILL